MATVNKEMKTFNVPQANGDIVKYEVVDAQARSDLETKAEVDGYYEDMTVGDAEQLVTAVGVVDKVPYNFRTAGGSVDIGDRESDTLVGGTVAWNQQYDPSNSIGKTFTESANYWGSLGTASKVASVIKDHVYFFSAYITRAIATNNYIDICPAGSANHNIKATLKNGDSDGYACTVVKSALSASGRDVLYVNAGGKYGIDAGDSISVTKLCLIDLTQMFGSTIADHICTLETGTAGAGVAWFKNLFPKDYYAYDAGSLQSVQAKSHILRGFNAWDEEWENGRINITNGEDLTGNGIRSKNKIKVVSGATYHEHFGTYETSGSIIVYYYDSSENFLSYEIIIGHDFNFTIPTNACYIRFNIQTSNAVTTYGHDICINLHWDGERDGEYEPYNEHVYDLGSDELRGVFMLDSNNKLYCNGDTKTSDGTINRMYMLVDLGTLEWSYSSGSGQMYATISDMVTTNNPAVVCAKYTQVIVSGWADLTVNGTLAVGSGQIRILDTSYTDTATFKTAMSGVYLVCERATPTTESADPFSAKQIVDNWGTEEYVDAGVTASTPTRDVAIPVGHVTNYLYDLKAKIESSANPPDSNGDYLLRHNNGENTYVAYVPPLPTNPSENGTYTLKCTVSGSTKTLSWVQDI